MWRLNYKKDITSKWHRQTFLFKLMLFKRVIDLKKQQYDVIVVTPLNSNSTIKECNAWRVEYRQCNITIWRTKYFSSKLKAKIFIWWLKQKQWDDQYLEHVNILDLIS